MANFTRPKQFKFNVSSVKGNFSTLIHSQNGNQGINTLESSQSKITSRLFLFLTFCWIIPLLISVIVAVFNYSSLPYQIPLFYSRLWGTAQLASAREIFVPSIGAFVIGIFNLFLAAKFLTKDKVVAYLLGSAAILVSFLAFLTTVNIVNLVR